MHNLNALIHNRFDIEVVDSKTGKIKQRAQAFNVICDSLWDILLIPAPYFNKIIYGSGFGTPSASDVTLFDKIAAYNVTNEVTNLDTVNGVYSNRRQITINETTSVGETISEVGIGYDDNQIVTHAMLQDMNGNPITITKTDTDIITFYATIYVHFNPNGYEQGKVMFLANNTDVLRAIAIGNFALNVNYSTILKQNRNSVRDIGGDAVTTRLTTNLENKTITCKSDRFSVSMGNTAHIGGTVYKTSVIRGVLLYSSIWVDYDCLYNTSIVNESIATGDGNTTDFSTKFPIKRNAKIYINGIEDSSATTTNYIHNRSHVSNTFQGIDKYGKPSCEPSAFPSGIIFNESDWYYVNPHLLPINKAFTNRDIGSDYVAYSNDLINWTTIPYNTELDPPVTARYWHLHIGYRGSDFGDRKRDLLSPDDTDYNIHFQTPPPAGAVITADYVPDCLPKDENHVFDFSLTITLGEYTGN